MVSIYGIIGAILLTLEFPVSAIVLGYVLGPMLEENFRRAMLVSNGHLSMYIERPISECFIAATTLLLLVQLYAYFRKMGKPKNRQNHAGEGA
jgi:TctA family transporter